MDDYAGGAILCRRCLIKDVPEAELLEYLDAYVRDLPADTRVSPREFERRLALCADCEYLIKYTCRLCGCYAQVRAARRLNRCPLPGAPRWDARPDGE